jgi:LasA protease
MTPPKPRSLYLLLIGACLLLSCFAGCRREVIPLPPTAVSVPVTPTSSDSRSSPMPRDGKLGQAAVEEDLATPTPSVPPSPTPTREPPADAVTTYNVRVGDTLSRIALVYGTTVDALMTINGLTNADQLVPGQELKITMAPSNVGPAELLIPDSELVYGPTYADFSVAAAIEEHAGYLLAYTEVVNGREMTGPEIVELVSVQYSVGPRVLLTLLELRGTWLSSAILTPTQQRYPLGYQAGLYREGLYWQLSYAANALNGGFYSWWDDTSWLVQTLDGALIQYSAELNAATAAVQKMLADTASDYESWLADLTRFSSLYIELFGDPFDVALEPLLPPYSGAPALTLPWSKGETWYYTGGPHPGWGSLGAYAAIDFATDEVHIGCTTSQRWVTAVAPGVIVMSEDGMVLQDLDGDGLLSTGWVVLYMHIAADNRVAAGTEVATGDRIGHPSCEGGVSSATHLHLAWRMNGVWIAADDARWPMRLDGWQPVSGNRAYDGTLEKDGRVLTACECWEKVNAITH